MVCKRCQKECLESEVKNGYCLDCFEKYAGDMSKLKKIDNSIANYFKTWSIITIIIGILLGVVAFFANYGVFISLTCLLTVIVISTFLRAISEIIQLLEDIKNK